MNASHVSLVTTDSTWDDLILDKETRKQVEEIKNWIKHSSSISLGRKLEKKVKPGFRTLFYGPPGTGKTLTATLIGKEFGKPVYKIDLQLLVSKYIGETEKNVAAVFDAAEKG